MQAYPLNLIWYYLIFLVFSFWLGLGLSALYLNRKLTFSSLIIAPVVGFYHYALGLTISGYLGFGTTESYIPVAFLLSLPTLYFIFAIFTKKTSIDLSKKEIASFLLLHFLTFLIGIVTMMPTLVGHTIGVFNDGYTYVSISDYLRNHGFFPIANPDNYQWQTHIYLYQLIKARIGAQYVFSAFVNFTGEKFSFWVYPALQALGLGLLTFSTAFFIYKINKSVFAIFLVCFFILTAFVYSIVPLWNGFFPQIFGLSLFILGLSTISMFEKKEISFKTYSLILSTVFAGLLNIYTEMFPFFIIVMGLYFLLRRKLQFSKKFIPEVLLFFSPLIISMLVFSIFYLYAFIYIKHVYKAVVGYHQPFGLNQIVLWLFGQEPYLSPSRVKQLFLLSGSISAWISLAIGIWYLFKAKYENKSIFFAVFIVFLVFIFYYRFGSYNPFVTDTLGYSWNVWKLIGWLYIYLLVVVALGMVNFMENNKIKMLILGLILTSISIGSFPILRRYIVSASLDMKQILQGQDPLDSYRNLERKYSNKNNENVITIATNKHPAYSLLTNLFLGKAVSDWTKEPGGLIPGIKPENYQPRINKNSQVWIDSQLPAVSNSNVIDRQLSYNIYRKGSNVYYFQEGFSNRELLEDKLAVWMIGNNAKIKAIAPDDSKKLSITIITPRYVYGTLSIFDRQDRLVDKLQLVPNTPIKYKFKSLDLRNYEVKLVWSGSEYVGINDPRTLKILFFDMDVESAQ